MSNVSDMFDAVIKLKFIYATYAIQTSFLKERLRVERFDLKVGLKK